MSMNEQDLFLFPFLELGHFVFGVSFRVGWVQARDCEYGGILEPECLCTGYFAYWCRSVGTCRPDRTGHKKSDVGCTYKGFLLNALAVIHSAPSLLLNAMANWLCQAAKYMDSYSTN